MSGHRPYYGWYVVGVALLVCTLVVGTTFSAIGLFVLPVSAEFGLSRADMNSTLIVINVGNAALAPFVGRLLDRVRYRWVMLGSALLFGAGMTALGLSTSIWLDVVILFVAISAAMLGAGTLGMPLLVARWFDHNRGRALALAAIGLSLGGVVAAPVIGFLIEREGWRMALIIAAAAVTPLLILIGLVIRERPGPGDVEPRPAGAKPSAAARSPAGVALRPATVLRMPVFWLIALGAAIPIGTAQALVITIVPLARGVGLPLAQAASLLSAFAAAAVTGKLLLAVIADRFDRTTLFAGIVAFGVLPNLGFMVSDTFPLLLVCAAMAGATTAVVPPILYALIADRFGTAAFGTVRGLTSPVLCVVGAIMVRFAGEVFDRTGHYDIAFATFCGLALVATALIVSVRGSVRCAPLSPHRDAESRRTP